MLTTNELVARAAEIQTSRGWSDGYVARQMDGISRAYWSLLKQGKRQPGIRALRGIAAVFPELRGDVVSLLSADSPEVAVA